MKALSQAIYTKASTSGAFWTAIGGRFYKGIVDPTKPIVYPYVVYMLVSDNADGGFREDIEDCDFQFSIFSASSSSSEIEDLYTALKSVFDKCSLTVTGYTFLHMLRKHSTLFADELPNPNGTGWVWHYATDYNILIQKN